ncbi:C-3 sterol dehydrogenase/C-4 decarboxylase-like protein [Massariosphaeria phaeospora]|uniref:C-3 sterol dehydrogenase/C-4 decarboxylase-like protein n=1 Tax=Massariosphaeria phaeospora TaxID=100035 RepID=A0A7C8M5W9_9PLEO|nr:C-3 sterol dehydrogenase/C-4 decarboxylase-like protein [Massariosphaeria phaeospora]
MENPDLDSLDTVLVTGGGGCLGSHIVDAFAAEGSCDSIALTVRDPNKARRAVPGTAFHVCDVADREETRALLEHVKPRIIVHTVSPDYMAPKKAQYEINYLATKTLLELARADANVQALIYTSSVMAVPLGHLSEPWTEDEAPVNDLNTGEYYYNRTKGAADTLVREASFPKPVDAKDWSGCLLTTCLRLSGIYGPRDTNISPSILNLANTAGARILFGPDTAMLEWVFVESAAHAHLLAAKALLRNLSGVSGEAFFITDGKPMKFGDWCRTAWKEAGDANMNSAHPSFFRTPFGPVLALLAVWEWVYQLVTLGQGWPKTSRQTFFYIRHGCWFSIEKARARLGYEPLCGTEEGIKRTARWFRENQGKKGM